MYGRGVAPTHWIVNWKCPSRKPSPMGTMIRTHGRLLKGLGRYGGVSGHAPSPTRQIRRPRSFHLFRSAAASATATVAAAAPIAIVRRRAPITRSTVVDLGDMQRPAAIFDSSSGRMREKRVLERSDGEDVGHPEPKKQKVPALASVIVEALKVDSLQKLCSSLEPILRRVVSEEVERALAKLGTPKLTGRSSPKRIEGPDGRTLQLQFRSRLSFPLFTGGKVEGEQGTAILVVLLDAEGNVVTTGPQSCAKLDIVVLEGDFNNEDDDDWNEEEFESHVVKEREGKRPLLTGDLQVTLKEGVGALGDLTFTDNSSWIRSRKFRLGLRVSPGYSEGIRIREAKTEAFAVKDHRGELYKKHYPPALNDDVWRLEKIGKDGSFHKRLNKAGIHTVEDFLRLVVRDPQRLRNVLGGGMSNKMWESLVEHAKTCVLSGKHYVYYQDDSRSVGVLFNNIYELRGLIAGDQYYPAESLDESQKVYVDSLVKKAYDNWLHVVEYDGRALLGSKQKKRSGASGSTSTMVQVDHQPSSFDRPMAVSVTSDHDLGSNLGGVCVPTGYIENPAEKYLPSSLPSSNTELQFEQISYAPQNELHNSSHQHQMGDTMSLALGPPQSSGLGYLPLSAPSGHQTSNLNSYDDWSRHRDNGTEDFFAEEEIRMRSHEILENEDMQHLLRVFSMGGTGVNLSDDGYSYPAFMPTPSPNYGFYEGNNRSSGKAVVGWLKLKAALRWGIFIRKRAAEKRAQLVELDD